MDRSAKLNDHLQTLNDRENTPEYKTGKQFLLGVYSIAIHMVGVIAFFYSQSAILSRMIVMPFTFWESLALYYVIHITIKSLLNK